MQIAQWRDGRLWFRKKPHHLSFVNGDIQFHCCNEFVVVKWTDDPEIQKRPIDKPCVSPYNVSR